MRKLLKSFKTEINPTIEQKIKINKTIGTCRYVYNFYLGHNKTLYNNGEKFMTGKSFSVWLNNEYIPNNPDKIWIKKAYSKAVKKSIEDGCTAFTRFFKQQSSCPNFKKKGKMMKNRHLSKAVASQKFYEFRTKLKAKCDENGIELRVVDRWYPSSQICHCCGAIKKDLKLSDRIYRCNCGYVEDRDFNAALNLRDALTYEVA